MPLTLRKRGRYWHARGSVPARQADGKIRRVRIEESTRVESRTRARKIASDIEQYYHELAYYPERKRGPTFAEAAITYIQTRGRSDTFVTKLIKFFGETPLEDIDQAAAMRAAESIYPGASAATVNRAVVTPLLAMGANGLVRPAGHDASPPLDIPGDEWFDEVLPHCPPKLAALLVFLTLRGRRVGEAIALKRNDMHNGTVTIPKTKTGDPVTVTVPSLSITYLKAPNPKGYQGGNKSKHLFGYHSVPAAHLALTKACKKAGVKRYGFHALGRHAFATRLLKAGRSLKHVQVAGGWKTIGVVANRYLHLAKSEVAKDVDMMGEEWGASRAKPAQAVGMKGGKC